MCKINSSEQDILSYKCNTLNFSEHEFNYAPLANFVSTNLKNPVFSKMQDWTTINSDPKRGQGQTKWAGQDRSRDGARD